MVAEDVDFVDCEMRAVYAICAVDAEFLWAFPSISEQVGKKGKVEKVPSFLINRQISRIHSTGTFLSPHFIPFSSFPVSYPMMVGSSA
jgi:hypothetical protein